jgi:rhodanese-related sulfurtransferase
MSASMALLALARDTVLLGVAALGLGITSLAVRLDVPWTPPPAPPEPTACGVDESFEPAGDPGLARIAVAELRTRMPGVVIVDARSTEAFVDGHIPGAVSLPAAEIDGIIANESLPLPVDRDIVTYCDRDGGVDAEYVGRALDLALGCDRVIVLDGGYAAWLASDGPVEGALQSG